MTVHEKPVAATVEWHTPPELFEALGLAWSDVTPEAITVRHALQRVEGEWQLRPPKTAKGRRTIPLTPLGVEALRAQRAMQLEDRYGAGDSRDAMDALASSAGPSSEPMGRGVGVQRAVRQGLPNITPLDDSLVFTTSTGHPIHATNLLPKLRADLAAAGLPKVGIHDLRHSFASLLIAEGVSIPAIAKLLGHSSPRMVMEVYGHVVKELEVDAIDRLDRRLG